jgi:putative peptidoglycan lipid II flippase
VAAGILLSRLAGFVRLRVFAHYFGQGDAADAFSAALKIPNFLQNLFGEGVLSASFIPVYAGLLGKGDEEEADRVAGVIATVLSLVTAVLVLLGILATPLLIGAIAPGFAGEKRQVTIQIVRILFPGVGLLVLSAWCLGVLNSHRRFFLSYAAPVVWNFTMIAAMLAFGARGSWGGGLYRLAEIVAAAASVGSLLQIAMQLPTVLSLARGLRLSLDLASAHVREVFRNFGPVVLSRGVVQVSAYVDQMIASFLGTGAVAGLTYAQTLYTLPVSLFGMAVSASELPEMSRATGGAEEVAAYLRGRLGGGLRRIAFLVVPSAMAFLALGDVVAGLVYQTGRFTHAHAVYVWAILAGSAVGLLASTLGRLYSSTFYALHDTKTPLRYAAIRVALTTALGYLCALPLPRALGIDPAWGAAGLTASAGVAGWVEFLLLSRGIGRRIGAVRLPGAFLARLWAAAAAGAALGWAAKLLLGARGAAHPLLLGVVVLGLYGVGYFGASAALGLAEARQIAGTVLRRLGRR